MPFSTLCFYWSPAISVKGVGSPSQQSGLLSFRTPDPTLSVADTAITHIHRHSSHPSNPNTMWDPVPTIFTTICLFSQVSPRCVSVVALHLYNSRYLPRHGSPRISSMHQNPALNLHIVHASFPVPPLLWMRSMSWQPPNGDGITATRRGRCNPSTSLARRR